MKQEKMFGEIKWYKKNKGYGYIIGADEETYFFELINCIKNEKIILACTHYHLIKDLLDVFNVSYLSNEEQIFNDIESSKELNIYVKEKDYLEIKKYIKVGIY